MITRILPQDEWPRLAHTSCESVWALLRPEWAEVIVVEEAGQIVGSVVLMSVLHAECLENKGGPGVAHALWRAIRDRTQVFGTKAVWGSSLSDPMDTLLQEHGHPVAGSHFLVSVS